jgi:hypothetical protein
MALATCNTITIVSDPFNVAPCHVSELHARAGILMLWALTAIQESNRPHVTMCELYRNQCEPMKGGELTDEGVYTYAGDTDLFPYFMIGSGDRTIYLYPYGMVGIIDPHGKTVYRMD